MNIAIWLVQILLALLFFAVGLGKLTQPKDKLAERMGWVEDFSPGAVKTIGALEILAALGLILPATTGIASVLTPLAAVGLGIVMLGAMTVHVRRRENQEILVNLVLLLLVAGVAWGRFGPYAF